MNAYAFLLRREFDGSLAFDAFLDVTLGLDYKVRLVKERLTGQQDLELSLLASHLQYLNVRRRYASETRGPFVIKTDGPMTRDELEGYVQSLSNKELERFMLDSGI